MHLGRFYIWSKRCKLLKRRRSFLERLARFKTCYFDCNVAYSSSIAIIRLSVSSFTFLKPPFPGFSNLLSFPLYFCSSPFNDHSRFSRSSARFTLAFFHSEISPSRIRLLPKSRASPYRKWLFLSSTKPFRNSNGVTFCHDTMGQVSNAEDNKTREVGSGSRRWSRILRRSFLLTKGSSSVPPSYRIGLFPYANDYYDSRSIKHHDASQFP